ncbi:MAG: pyrrolo-quinoline quinone, partial [Limisphaerales bacterium]
QQERLGVGGEYYATPVSTGDRILIAAERGTIFVLKAGPKLDILVRNEIGESLVATPAIADDTLYLRSFKRLWAFRQEE